MLYSVNWRCPPALTDGWGRLLWPCPFKLPGRVCVC